MKGRVKVFVALLLIGAILLICGCNTDWLYGHDDGEAYEHHREMMKKYIDENGLEPDIYGYGW